MRREPLSADRDEAEDMFDELKREARQNRDLPIDRRQQLLDAKKRQLSEHLDDYVQYLANKNNTERYVRKPQALLWPGTWTKHRRGTAMLRHDLKAARIPFRDDSAHVFDFHALRHRTFITSLARAGVHPKEAQELAGTARSTSR